MKKRGGIILWMIIAVILLIAGFFVYNNSIKTSISDNRTNITIANPASVYCSDNGGKLEMRTDDNGGQYGVCVFANGSECEEWKFLRGECGNMSDGQSCSKDTDCVPATCCHPKSCVSKNSAPDCSGTICTMSCEVNSLDCGYGSCRCLNQKCKAVFG